VSDSSSASPPVKREQEEVSAREWRKGWRGGECRTV
jgi:hypothetical protein